MKDPQPRDVWIGTRRGRVTPVGKLSCVPALRGPVGRGERALRAGRDLDDVRVAAQRRLPRRQPDHHGPATAAQPKRSQTRFPNDAQWAAVLAALVVADPTHVRALVLDMMKAAAEGARRATQTVDNNK